MNLLKSILPSHKQSLIPILGSLFILFMLSGCDQVKDLTTNEKPIVMPEFDGAYALDKKQRKYISLFEYKVRGRLNPWTNLMCLDAESAKNIPFIELENLGDILIQGDYKYKLLTVHPAMKKENGAVCINKNLEADAKLKRGQLKAKVDGASYFKSKNFDRKKDQEFGYLVMWIDNYFWYIQSR